MKQKKCPQCKNLISLDSPTCMYCGRPNKFVTNKYVKRKWDKKYNKDKYNYFEKLISKKTFFIYFIILIILVIILYK